MSNARFPENIHSNKKRKEKKRPLPIAILIALLQFVILVGIPMTVVNMMLPSYWIDLNRVDSKQVNATIRQNIFFVIPIPPFALELSDIVNPNSSVNTPGSTRTYYNGKSRMIEAEENGLLLMKSRNGITHEVYAEPDDLSDLTYEINSFIENRNELKKRIWVTANKKIGFYLPLGLALFFLVAFGIGIKMLITGEPQTNDQTFPNR